MLTLKSRWSVLLAVSVALLLLGSVLLAGCGKKDDNNSMLLLMMSNKNVAGYWEVTMNNGVHDSKSYMSLSQSDTTVTGGFIIPGTSVDNTQISGSVSSSTVNLSYTDGSSTRTFTGTVALFGGSISNGTWSDSDGSTGTWSATTVGNVAVISGIVSSSQGQYGIGLSAGGPKTQTLASLTVTGPNISNQLPLGLSMVLVILATKPAVGDKYTVTLNYSDSTSENIDYTVDSVYENAPVITSPTEGEALTSTTPTFTFQLAADTAYYSMMVSCNGGTGLSYWDYEALPSKTSITYNEDGKATAPLSSGQTCIMIALALDANDNYAMAAMRTFTIN